MNNPTTDLKNYYEVLEIPAAARSEEIYHSYQRAKAAYSSDSLALYSLMSPEECRNVLELVEEAYSILSDPTKRKRYDEARGFNRDFNSMNYNTMSDRVAPLRSERADSYPIQTPSSASAIAGSSSEFTLNSQATGSDPALNSLGQTTTTTNVNKLVTQKRFALDYVINADFEKEVEDATEFTGDFLRKIREYKNLDLDRLSDMTKVSRLYLQGIELEDFGKLPAAVYVRGFVFQYAKCLKLKPEVVANSYVARMKKLKP
ncbi:MAG: helix-turn-helix domain-containing protein [Rhizobacter sp.]|nr:helix-turn-helix domain-containing protein [Bacteriovorax sp.]